MVAYTTLAAVLAVAAVCITLPVDASYIQTAIQCGLLPALTGDTTTSAGSCATSTVKVNGSSIPASASFTGTNSSSQFTAMTTAQAISTLGVPSVAVPYLLIGSTYYTMSGYTAVRPSATPAWINSVAPGTVTAGANGDLMVAGTGVYWASLTASATVEGEFQFVNLTSTGAGNTVVNGGVWLYDSTNGAIWKLYVGITATTPSTSGASVIALDKYTYSGTGNPAYNSTPVAYVFPGGSAPVHLKMSVASTTLSLLISLDGGATFTTFGQTESVGTITKGGYAFLGNSTMTVLSITTT